MRADIKNKVTRRLGIISGQVKGIQRMVDEEKYCIEVINQVEAIREALGEVRNLMLKNHLLTHLVHQIKNGEEEKSVREMVEVYKLVGKK